LLGTFVEVSADCDAAIESGFDAIARVHRLMSAHEPDSDLSRINRFAHRRAVEIDPWTALVLERALSWSRESAGAFDVVRAGKAALERGFLPRHPDQPPAEAAHWTWLTVQGSCARLLRPACIDLGGIAKGFAVDRAVEAMAAAGATRGLVNAGGDIRGFGPETWPVTVVEPATRRAAATIGLKNMALATSAGLPCETGLQFQHLPLAGGEWLSVTVQAASCCDADALTKIVWASGHHVAHLLRNAGAQAFAIAVDGSVTEIVEEKALA
jgi:thiamine biosynthesis lipoprotein